MASWSITPNDTASINASGKATFQANTSNTPREYTVTYTSDNGTVCEMKVTQQGNVCSFTYAINTDKIPLAGGNYRFGTLTNADGIDINVVVTAGSEFINGSLSRSGNDIVGNVKQNGDPSAVEIPERVIKYKLKAGDVDCGGGDYTNTQDGKACTCKCTDLSVSPNSLSWLYNEGASVNKTFKITPGCTTDVTIDKSGAGWFVVSDMDASGVVTVHPTGENDTQGTKSGHVVIKFKACGKSCDAQFEKTINFTQGANACSCTVLHYTSDTSVIPGDHGDLYKIGSFTVDGTCDYNLFDVEITSQDDPDGIVVGETCEIDQSSPHGVWVHVNPNLPREEDEINLKFNYKVKFNGEQCNTGTKELSYCKCDYLYFGASVQSRYDMAAAKDVVIGVFMGMPWFKLDCLEDIEFFSRDTNVVTNFRIDIENGTVIVDLPEVYEPTATTFGYRFKYEGGKVCEDGFKVARSCICPTDNCCIYNSVAGIWVYYHPMHIDAAYYNLDGRIVDNGYVTSPHVGDSVLLPNNTVTVQPGLIYNGDIQRGGTIEWYCPSDMSCSGDGKYPRKTGNYQIIHGGGPLYDDDIFIVTNGSMTVTVRYKDGYWTGEGADRKYKCPFLDYWVNTNGTSSSRDTEIIFNVPDGTHLNSDCLDPDDYKNGKLSCNEFKVIIRQASANKKYIRKCIDSYSHDSTWLEVPYYYMCPNTGQRECWQIPSVVEGTMVTYTARNKVTAIGNSTFGSTVTNHIFTENDGDKMYSLGEVDLAGNATTVNGSTFAGNTGLTTVNLPKTVTSIAANAFANCTNLISVILNSDTPPTLGSNAFVGNESHRRIYVPADKVNAYKTAWPTYASVIEANPVTYDYIY